MVKVRSSMQWIAAAGTTCLLLVGISFYLDDPDPLNVFLIVSGVGLLGFWLSTPLKIGPDEVVIRPTLRARRIARKDIVATGAVRTNGWPAWQQLRLLLEDGSSVTVDRVAQLRDGGAVDRARHLLAD